jgi:hypothetical protein
MKSRGIGRQMCKALMGEMRIVYEMVTGRSVRTRTIQRPGCRWRSNIEREVKEIVFKDVHWIQLAEIII